MAFPVLVPRSVTLDEFVALGDEIAALARAGVPLDKGLRELSQDLPGRLGRLAGDLGQRLQQGESLPQILAKSPDVFPPAYRAVIEVGLRVGRLPAALEETTRTARRIRQLRSSLAIALLYPLLVVLLAWGLFIFTAVRTAPSMLAVLTDFQPLVAAWQPGLRQLSETWFWWGPAVPVFVICAAAWFWYRSGQVVRGVELHSLFAWGALGTLRRLQWTGRMAAMTDLLALLVVHQVPLDEAVDLASQAVGSPRLAAGGKELAERIRRGQAGGAAPPGFSPLLTWTLTSGSRQNQLAPTLQRTAQFYRQEFRRQSQWLTLVVPLFATAIVGGLVVTAYALFALGPWIIVLRSLVQPVAT